ncbi:MAG: hypothetical protein GF390_02110 [Candidatus Pacebacteria bacterium]|nr:hypothetical protein [Candidatus Paceibacterota bacterium]
MTAQLKPFSLIRLSKALLIIGVMLSALILSLGQLTKPVNAQKENAISLTAIPPRLGDQGQIEIKPGEKHQAQIKIFNESQETLDVETFVQDFIVDEDGKTPIALEGKLSNRWSLASWITVSPNVNKIAPRQTVLLNVLIEVPADALPGGHYAMILHQPVTPGAELNQANQAAASIAQKVGTLLYVVVEGPVNEEAFIRNFEIAQFSEYGPVPFSYEIENLSDIHIRPRANLEIYNLFNQRVANITVPTKNIFPFTSRDFQGEWERIWGFGWYKAKLVVSYGSGQLITNTRHFWLLPIKIILAALILLLTAVIIILAIRRHYQHRQKLEQKKLQALQEKVKKLENEQ